MFHRQFTESLQAFMRAYEVAFENSIPVAPEIEAIAPVAARFLHERGLATSLVCRALVEATA